MIIPEKLVVKQAIGTINTMTILFMTRKYPPSVGGMELFAYELSKALAAKIDLRLVTWGGNGRTKAVLIALPYLFIRSFWQLSRGGIEVIHAQDGLLAPVGYVLAKLFRKPYTVQLHGLDITYKHPLFRLVVPAAVRRAEVVFCISQAAADIAVSAGVAASKIQVIPLAVTDKMYTKDSQPDLRSKLGLAGNTKTLLTVGRLVKRKGVAWFVDKVMPELARRYPELVYVVIGDGSDRPDIEAAIKRQNLAGRVRLLGRVDEGLRAAAYNGADVFVMPNINLPGDMEGFGLVLLEAALCAKPVVAADTEGITEAIKANQNGILIPVEDAAAYINEISHILGDTKYANRLGQKARQFTLENYQWPKQAERYIELYKTLQSP